MITVLCMVTILCIFTLYLTLEVAILLVRYNLFQNEEGGMVTYMYQAIEASRSKSFCPINRSSYIETWELVDTLKIQRFFNQKEYPKDKRFHVCIIFIIEDYGDTKI